MTRARIIVASQLATLVVVRVMLHASPDSDFDVAGYNVHHLFTGVLVMVVCVVPLLFDSRATRANALWSVGFGAGLSMVLDEWVYLIVTDGSNASYLLPESWIGGVALNLLVAAYILWAGRTPRPT